VIYAGIIGGTIALSLLAGLAAGSNLLRAVAIGLYVAGALLFFGCFVMGARGPLRGVSRTGETVPLMGARGVRRASVDERSEATRISILLFVLGLSLVVLGALVDPAHKTF
jgi:hypothetical protein